MKQKNKKLDKRTKLQRLKRYVNGESLAEEVLEPIKQFHFVLITDREQLERREKGIENLTEQERKLSTNGNVEFIFWHEERAFEFPSVKPKTYPDPEIPGVSYSNPANVPEVPNSADKSSPSKELDKSEGVEIKPAIKPQKKCEQVPIDWGHKMSSPLTEQYRNIFRNY